MNTLTWILVTDDISAASLANLALQSGGEAQAFVFGPRERAEAVARLGVKEVVWFEADGDHPAENFASVVAGKAADEAPGMVVAADEQAARALVGGIIARLGALCASSVVTAAFEGDTVVVEHLVAEGAAVEVLESDRPVVCFIADGCPEAEEAAAVEVDAADAQADCILGVVALHDAAGGGDSLASAERVVSAGMGIGPKDNLALVEAVAKALDAEMACSLPLCDNYHWFEHERVVGSSTQKISPRLYLAFGVSGQPQHMMGVRSAKTIVAVNNDPDAPIFRECAYGIVGDLTEVAPALVEALSAS